MFSIYIADLIILPLMMLIGMKVEDRRSEKSLLNKADTKILKGISACFVVMAHYITYIDNINASDGRYGGTIYRCIYAIISQLGGIGVLIFFFLSGYGIYISYIDRTPDGEFILKRVKTVYLPYIIIKVILEMVYIAVGIHSETWNSALLSILLIKTAGDWFIRVILIQYVVFFLCWRYAGKKKVLLLSILMDFIVSAIFIIEKRPIGWFNALWLFIFGMACGKYEEKICNFLKNRLLEKIALLLAGFGMAGVIFTLFKGKIWANIFKPLSGMMLCMTVCGGSRYIRLGSKIMEYIGERSLYVYILHMNMWKLTESVTSPILRFWIAIILTVAGMELSYRGTSFLRRKTIKRM